ncbi:hypothetical protein WOC76_12445 [Methylocystis sp. IM3]|uniref:hypothetical protein n=1 Tax=Methylocystis sp. IM3 TaxID=3136722 RepID=UPI000FA0CDF4|nr:MAG: hypothetical protein EKK29_04925 [Hyphomicrobiales bacterium]
MSDKLNELIADHLLAVRAFRHACDQQLGPKIEDEAFEAEELAMMALCSYPPGNIEEARRRACYLLLTRFAADLTMEGLALLQSFTATGP